MRAGPIKCAAAAWTSARSEAPPAANARAARTFARGLVRVPRRNAYFISTMRWVAWKAPARNR